MSDVADLSLEVRLLMAVALGDIREPGGLPADEFAERRRQAATLAIEHGFRPEQAGQVADGAYRALTAFAEASRAVARAAQAVLDQVDNYPRS